MTQEELDREFFRKAGSRGGKKTADKYDKETRKEWGKKGGRPKQSNPQAEK